MSVLKLDQVYGGLDSVYCCSPLPCIKGPKGIHQEEFYLITFVWGSHIPVQVEQLQSVGFYFCPTVLCHFYCPLGVAGELQVYWNWSENTLLIISEKLYFVNYRKTNCHCPSVRMRKGKENEGLWWRRDFFSPPRQGKRIFICWLTILVFYSLEKYLSHLNLHRSTLCLEAWFLSTSEKTVVVSICTK